MPWRTSHSWIHAVENPTLTAHFISGIKFSSATQLRFVFLIKESEIGDPELPLVHRPHSFCYIHLFCNKFLSIGTLLWLKTRGSLCWLVKC